MDILTWVFLGLVAGLLAKWVMPGAEASSWVMTILLGIAGAMVGGYLGSVMGVGVVSGFNLVSIALSVLGACVLLFAYRLIFGGGTA